MTWYVAKIAEATEANTLARAQWVADMLNASAKIATEISVTPEAIVAQAAQESGWGESKQGQFGLFGQKVTPDWTGLKVLCRTREDVDGEWVTEEDWFRDYPSLAACLDDHFAFLRQNSRYAAAGVFDQRGDEAYFHALSAAGYATDPNYADELMAVEGTITKYFMPLLAMADIVPPPRARLLMVGMRGPDVALAQDALKANGFYGGTVDGDFGHLTFNAVENMQTIKGITVDGVIGDESRHALGIA